MGLTSYELYGKFLKFFYTCDFYMNISTRFDDPCLMLLKSQQWKLFDFFVIKSVVSWECVPQPFFPFSVLCGNDNVIYMAEASGDVQVKDHRLLLCLRDPSCNINISLCQHGNRLPSPTAVCCPLKYVAVGPWKQKIWITGLLYLKTDSPAIHPGHILLIIWCFWLPGH